MNVHVLLLAAGRGTRLQGFFDGPKPLVPFGNEPLLQRTLRQFRDIGLDNITVVTGYEADRVASVASEHHSGVSVVFNERYAEDKNIYSALCGLRTIPENVPVLILEGDVAFSDRGLRGILEMVSSECSSWGACGGFLPYQMGIILRPGASGHIKEVVYTEYAPEFSSWLKNLGVVYLTSNQRGRFMELLERYVTHSLDYYYMTPWADHLEELPAGIVDVGRHGGMSFNTGEEYRKAVEYLASEKCGPLFQKQDTTSMYVNLCGEVEQAI